MFKYPAIAVLSWLAACKTPILTTYLTPAVHCTLVFLIYFISASKLTNITESLLEARQAKKLGCKPPVIKHGKLPFGWDMISRIIAADRRNEVPEEFPRIYKEMGVHTWKQSPLGSPAVLTVEPKNIQAILATQFNDFVLGSLRVNTFFPLLGHGIFTVDGKYWEHSRALLRPQFTRDQVADLDLEEAHVQNMFAHLRVDADSDGWTSDVNLGPLFFRLTLDSATEFLFGHSVQSQIQALPDTAIEKRNFEKRGNLDWHMMATCFDGALAHLGSRSRLRTLYWLHNPQDFKDCCAEVHRFADYYVNQALKSHSSPPSSDYPDVEKEPQKGKPRYIFLEELVKHTQDPIEIRSQLLNILLAGRDTTAGLLGWTFWLLARNPTVFTKLRTSILNDFGQDTKNITFASLKANTYLQNVLSETLRLFPAVPVNGRQAIRNTTIPRGGGPDGLSPVYIPKGTNVVYSVLTMQRRKDIWGEDAEEFRPERWSPGAIATASTTAKASSTSTGTTTSTATKNKKSGTGWEYLPFNGGPRICLGQQFALTEAGYVVVRILQIFDDIVPSESETNEWKHQFGVTSAPLRVGVRLRRSS